MKVIATKLGYFGKLREPGDEFEVPDGTKGSWFQPVEQKANGKGGKKPEAPASEKPADDLV
ncbi:hypothetical protein [Bordetella parapertussis]|uniref:hypothetical protein n=1 Tax=Bordetella parapertussis TaxID=519 RepID=UPI0002DC3127|nr:hypothetical protein [Bordetella parapertussis]